MTSSLQIWKRHYFLLRVYVELCCYVWVRWVFQTFNMSRAEVNKHFFRTVLVIYIKKIVSNVHYFDFNFIKMDIVIHFWLKIWGECFLDISWELVLVYKFPQLLKQNLLIEKKLLYVYIISLSFKCPLRTLDFNKSIF